MESNEEHVRKQREAAAKQRAEANAAVLKNIRRKNGNGGGTSGAAPMILGSSLASQRLEKLLKNVPKGADGNVVPNHNWVR